MASYKELIAANFTTDEIRQKVGADSLGHLSIAGLVGATGRERDQFCLGCLTGEYPSSPAFARANADGQPALKN
jgi:amidophosphoribosyltransferase